MTLTPGHSVLLSVGLGRLVMRHAHPQTGHTTMGKLLNCGGSRRVMPPSLGGEGVKGPEANHGATSVKPQLRGSLQN